MITPHVSAVFANLGRRRTASTASKRRASGQVGVMDRGLAAVLGAAALLGLIGVYFHNTSDTKAEELVDEVNTIAAGVQRLYNGAQGGLYTGMDQQVLAQTGSFPPQWVYPGQVGFYTPYKSGISITSFANPQTGVQDGAWNMTIRNLPQAACTTLGTTPLAPKVLRMLIGGNELTLVNSVASASDVTSACSNAATGTGVVDPVTLILE